MRLGFHLCAVFCLCLAGELPVERVREALRQLVREAFGAEKANALPERVEAKRLPMPVREDVVPAMADSLMTNRPPDVTQVVRVRSALPKVDENVPLKDEAVAIAEQQARDDAEGLGMGTNTAMMFVEEVGAAVKDAMPKSTTDLFERSGPNLEKAIAASVLSPPLGVVKPTPPQPMVQSSLPRVDANAKTVAKANPRVADVSPAEVLQLRAEFEKDDLFVDPTPPGVHVDPRPTAAKGVDAFAAANEEIASKRAVPVPPPFVPDPKRMVRSGGTEDTAENMRARIAYSLVAKGFTRQPLNAYLTQLDAIPIRDASWEDQYTVEVLVDTTNGVDVTLHLAGIDDVSGHKPEELDAGRGKPGRYWIRCQGGWQWANCTPRQVLSMLRRNEKPLYVLEVACMLVEYPWVLGDEPGSGIDCLGNHDQPFTIERQGDGSMLLRATYPDEKSEQVGAATRGSTTGIMNLNVN